MGEHQFIVTWDCTGLEYLGDITADEQQRIMAALKGEPYTISIPNFMHLKLRAQYNSHRHYEIYVFNAQAGITADDIREMFEANPQEAADVIRGIGHCLHSDRVDESEVVIR